MPAACCCQWHMGPSGHVRLTLHLRPTNNTHAERLCWYQMPSTCPKLRGMCSRYPPQRDCCIDTWATPKKATRDNTVGLRHTVYPIPGRWACSSPLMPPQTRQARIGQLTPTLMPTAKMHDVAVCWCGTVTARSHPSCSARPRLPGGSKCLWA